LDGGNLGPGLVPRYVGTWLFVGWLVLGLLQVSCAVRRPAAPGRPVLDAYLHALEANQPDRVYAMMDAAYRKKVSLELFRKLWKTYRPELQAEAKGIRRLLEHPEASKKTEGKKPAVDLVAQGAFPGRRPVVLSWQDGHWVVAAGPGTELAGGGIVGALLMLVKVVEARNFSGFMAMLSDKSREAFWRGVSDRLTKLKTWLSTAKIQAQGDRVRIYYGSASHIDLVREKGRWRIEDFN